MKKSYVKVITLLMAVTMMMGLVTGCNKKASEPEKPAQATEEQQGEVAEEAAEEVILDVGNYPTSQGASRNYFDENWKKFEADNPGIKVEPDEFSFSLKTFYAKAEGEQLPDLFRTHFTEVRHLTEAGYISDISDLLKNNDYEGKFNEKVVDVITGDDGNIYAFPVSPYVLGLAYNTEMFEAAGLMEEDGTPKQPKDWDELVEFAVKIKEATGKPGFVFPTTNNQGGWMFMPIAWSYGTEFMKQDENGKWIATFNSPEATAALEYIKDLKWKYDVLPANTLIDSAEYYKTFGTGNAGMMIAGGGYAKNVAKYDIDPNALGIMEVPAGPKRHVTLLGGEVYVFANTVTEAEKEAGLKWIETMYSHEATEDFKRNKESEIDAALEANQLVGIKVMQPWSSDMESVAFEHALIDEKTNGNPNHVKLYNDSVQNGSIEIQSEEPICCQELYATIDACVQEVLTNKDADCAELLEKANSDFQTNYLDNM